MNAYYYLAIAICAEVIATVSMKAIKGFSTPLPLVLVIAGYATAFWMLTLVVRTIPVGVAYAVWAGMGIVMVSVAALFIYGQKLDIPAMLGMGLIVLGVVVIQLLPDEALMGVQAATSAAAEVLVEQVVAIQELPAEAENDATVNSRGKRALVFMTDL